MNVKHLVIPKGYQIIVKSWENDADNSNTETINGLTLEQAMLYRDIAILMDEASYNSDNKFGNMYEPSDEEITKFDEALLEVFNKHKHLGMSIFPSSWTVDFNDDEDIISAMYEIKSDLGLASVEFFTRIAKEIIINYFEEDIYATRIM